ncbi:MAG: hypothetical protein WB609_12200 [Candidatus Cybelea sp.]
MATRLALVLLTGGFLAACGKGTPITSGTPTPSPTLPPQVTAQYPIPTASSEPLGIALGSDGNLWVSEFASSKMARLNPGGKFSESSTPTRKAGPNGVASGPGPNLNVWFTETNVGRVAQVTVNGPPYSEYTLPSSAARPAAITLGSDGNMWVADPGTNSIWRVQQLRIKPHVRFTQFQLTGNAQPAMITNGPDGALWFTEPGTNSIGRLNVTGRSLTEYPLKDKNAHPMGITSGSNNELWFVEQKGESIVRMAITGAIVAEYPLNGAMTPDAIAQGIDGNFYFTDTAKNKIGQFFFHSHHVNFYSIPTPNSGPTAMTIGLDGQVYFVETAGNKVGQFRYFNV